MARGSMRRPSTAPSSSPFRPGTTGGRTLRLRGKGLPNPNGAPGDLLVTLRVTLPDESDSELSNLMRKWESGKPYNPRSDLG